MVEGMERGDVKAVILEEGKKGCRTEWVPDVSGRHDVALDVNVERFFDDYFSVFR